MTRPTFNDKTESNVQKHKSIWTSQQIWDAWQDVLYCNGSFWLWDGRVYKKIDDIEWTIITAKRFPAFDESAPSKQREIMEVYKRFAKVDSEKFNCEDGLCFENVYLDLKDLKTFAHDKKRINTILIPYEYNDKAECPLWIKSTNEIFEEDLNKIKCIQEFFGYCLTRETENAKALFCVGEGATGKSTILETLSMVVGKKNVSVLSPRYYRDSMRIASIENKLVLMSHEVPKSLEDWEADFRQIVCGQEIEANQKFIKPYTFKPYCKVVMAMNEIPYINDHTSAFYRRILPIEFNRQFEEEQQDKILLNKIKKELPGILNWALQGLKRLRERGVFFKDIYMQEHIEEIREQNNPIVVWTKENIEIALGKELTKQETYQKYTVWCSMNGYKPLGHTKFSGELFRIFSKVTKKNARSGDDKRSSIWPNLIWATHQIQEAQETWNE